MRLETSYWPPTKLVSHILLIMYLLVHVNHGLSNLYNLVIKWATIIFARFARIVSYVEEHARRQSPEETKGSYAMQLKSRWLKIPNTREKSRTMEVSIEPQAHSNEAFFLSCFLKLVEEIPNFSRVIPNLCLFNGPLHFICPISKCNLYYTT